MKKKKLDLSDLPGRKNCVSGATAFKMMDSLGLPLEIVIGELAKIGKCFDMVGFVEAAKASGNYSNEKLHAIFREAWWMIMGVETTGSDYEEKFLFVLNGRYKPIPDAG